MGLKQYLSGNEAVARGFYEGGGHLATAYPGSPSAETIKIIGQNYKEIYTEYSINEAVAIQMAVGASIAGGRVMANMKQLGLNVALDTLMTFTEAHINGGFLLYISDDPGLTASQNEQDSRPIGKYAGLGVLCPSTHQDMKDFAKISLQISEQFDLPVMLRTTTSLTTSSGMVELCERINEPIKEYGKDQSKYCMFPPFATIAQYKIKESITRLESYAYDTSLNRLEVCGDNEVLIITSGYMYLLLKELNPKADILKLGLIYPISKRRMCELNKLYHRIIVCEELTPFIENELKIMGIPCEGKEFFKFTGNIDIDDVHRGLRKAGVLCKTIKEVNTEDFKENRLAIRTIKRTPCFYSGCPHRPIFDILKDLDAIVVGDIGCHTIGMYFPWHVNEININMGSSPGIIKGIAEIYKKKRDNKPIIGLIGDGDFFHSGVLGIMNLLHQEPVDSNITIIILNNGAISLTGWQADLDTGNFCYCEDPYEKRKNYITCGDGSIKPEYILKASGFTDITIVDQFYVKKTREVIKDAICRCGIKIIIATRPCVVAFNIQQPAFVVNQDKCIACRRCVQLNCEPIRMKKYNDQKVLKAFIDPVLCNGCSVCAQVCPVNAIYQCE